MSEHHSTTPLSTGKPAKPYPEFPCSLMPAGSGRRRFAARCSTSASGMTPTAHSRSTWRRKGNPDNWYVLHPEPEVIYLVDDKERTAIPVYCKLKDGAPHYGMSDEHCHFSGKVTRPHIFKGATVAPFMQEWLDRLVERWLPHFAKNLESAQERPDWKKPRSAPCRDSMRGNVAPFQMRVIERATGNAHPAEDVREGTACHATSLRQTERPSLSGGIHRFKPSSRRFGGGSPSPRRISSRTSRNSGPGPSRGWASASEVFRRSRLCWSTSNHTEGSRRISPMPCASNSGRVRPRSRWRCGTSCNGRGARSRIRPAARCGRRNSSNG